MPGGGLAGVERDVQPRDKAVAQVAGRGLAQRGPGDHGARGRGHVVAIVMGLLDDRRGGRPVALLEQTRVELGGQLRPPLGRELGRGRLEPGLDLAAVVELALRRLARIGVPGRDGGAQVAAGLQAGTDPADPTVPSAAGTGGQHLHRGQARLLWRQAVQPLGEQVVAQRLAGDERPRQGEVAALLPQVYLHYDPYVRRWPEERPGSVVRQRMDFLLLLPQRRRIVLDVDGRHHYATENGTADPQQYARMLAEDRRPRLAGYEVYRFGGAELSDEEQGRTLLDAFFDKLLDGRPQQL